MWKEQSADDALHWVSRGEGGGREGADRLPLGRHCSHVRRVWRGGGGVGRAKEGREGVMVG